MEAIHINVRRKECKQLGLAKERLVWDSKEEQKGKRGIAGRKGDPGQRLRVQGEWRPGVRRKEGKQHQERLCNFGGLSLAPRSNR
jgi:hypothetical protein